MPGELHWCWLALGHLQLKERLKNVARLFGCEARDTQEPEYPQSAREFRAQRDDADEVRSDLPSILSAVCRAG